jgi:hypothetical protein
MLPLNMLQIITCQSNMPNLDQLHKIHKHINWSRIWEGSKGAPHELGQLWCWMNMSQILCEKNNKFTSMNGVTWVEVHLL